MTPCIAQVSTLSTSFEDDLAAYSAAGWPAVELWLTKLETGVAASSAPEVKTRLADLGLQAPSAAGQGGLLLGPDGAGGQARWDLLDRRLDLLAELGVETLVLAADTSSEARGEDFARAVDALGRAVERAKPRGVRLALEFQNRSTVCASLDTAAALVAHVGGANLGICLDLFHYYTGPSKFEDLGLVNAQNLASVQLCDVSGTPRELAKDADRIFPGEGDFLLGPILEHLVRIGYGGPLVLELLNPQIWAIPADRVAGVALRSLTSVLEQAEAAVSAGEGQT